MATATVDRLEPLGVGVGALLVLIGITTIVGTPWAYKSGGILLMFGQAFGALAAIALGAGLAWLARE